jgi:putative FmdB family regulatory protein
VPIYEYKCEKGHTFEAMQKMADDPLTECEECGAPVERVFHPVAVHFKGSGFYTTDYGSKSKGASDGGSKSSDGESKPSDGGSKSDGGDSKSSGDSGGSGEKKAKSSSGGD